MHFWRFIITAGILLLLGLSQQGWAGALSSLQSAAGGGMPSVPEVPNPVCGYCGAAMPNGQHSTSCPYYEAPGNNSTNRAAPAAPHKPAKPDMNAIVGGMVMKGVLEAVLNPPKPPDNTQEVISSQQQAEALKASYAAKARAMESATFRAKQQQMRWTYKQPEGPARTTADAPRGYKGVDDDLTRLAAQARAPFDTAGTGPVVPLPAASPTPFFGDSMAVADLRLLTEPENDPRIVDLREAKTYVVQSLKDEQATSVKKYSPDVAPGAPILDPPSPDECSDLRRKLKRYLDQRQKFSRTVNLASVELDAWQEQNQQALFNFAKEGIQYFTGGVLEKFAKRGEAADRLMGIYAKNADRMAAEGIDVAELARRIQLLKKVSTASQLADMTGKGQEWAGFMKDGLSALVQGLSADNAALEEILADPKVAAYFETELPALKAALDITRIAAGAKVFGKWAARKMPVIAGCEFAVNQSYNAFDWLLSFNRIVEARRVNGEVLASAQSLQRHIDQTRFELTACPY